jgi:hypothetical protein
MNSSLLWYKIEVSNWRFWKTTATHPSICLPLASYNRICERASARVATSSPVKRLVREGELSDLETEMLFCRWTLPPRRPTISLLIYVSIAVKYLLPYKMFFVIDFVSCWKQGPNSAKWIPNPYFLASQKIRPFKLRMQIVVFITHPTHKNFSHRRRHFWEKWWKQKMSVVQVYAKLELASMSQKILRTRPVSDRKRKIG